MAGEAAISAAFQLAGALAIAVGLAGTWLAARHRSGWLLCVASSSMWLPTMVTGGQWAAVANCALSIVICLCNFAAQAGRPRAGAARATVLRAATGAGRPGERQVARGGSRAAA